MHTGEAAGRAGTGNRRDHPVAGELAAVVAGVAYRTLYLWESAFEKLIENKAICQDFSPAHMGDVLVMREGVAGSNRGHYVLLAVLVAVRDQCEGAKKRFIWRFENLRPVAPIAGQRLPKVGRITFTDAELAEGRAS